MIWIVLAVAYYLMALATAWTWGRFYQNKSYYRDGKGNSVYGVDPTELKVCGFVSLLWPFVAPLILLPWAAREGGRRRQEAEARQEQLEKEIREAMPEVEKLLGEAMTPEVRVFMKNLKQLAG